jgi:hypothetical protein
MLSSPSFIFCISIFNRDCHSLTDQIFRCMKKKKHVSVRCRWEWIANFAFWSSNLIHSRNLVVCTFFHVLFWGDLSQTLQHFHLTSRSECSPCHKNEIKTTLGKFLKRANMSRKVYLQDLKPLTLMASDFDQHI